MSNPIRSPLLRRLRWLVQCIILPHHGRGIPLRVLQARKPGAVLTALSPGHGAGRRNLDCCAGCGGGRLFQSGQERLDGLGGEILVVVVIDLDHGGVHTGGQALDLDEGEEAVFGGFANADTQVLFDGLDDFPATAAAELAGCLNR